MQSRIVRAEAELTPGWQLDGMCFRFRENVALFVRLRQSKITLLLRVPDRNSRIKCARASVNGPIDKQRLVDSFYIVTRAGRRDQLDEQVYINIRLARQPAGYVA